MKEQAAFAKALERVQKSAETFERLPLDPSETAAWASFRASFAEYLGINARMWEHLGSGEARQAAELVESTKPILDRAQHSVEAMIEHMNRWAADERIQGERTETFALAAFLAAIAVSMGAAVFLGSKLTVAIVRPLNEVAGAAQRIAGGDTHQTISYHSNDELGTLADSFRAMMGYVADVASLNHTLEGVACEVHKLTAAAKAGIPHHPWGRRQVRGQVP